MNELLIVLVVQVCLESLPISSSGHVMLANLLCVKLNSFSYALPEHFDHFLHGPTLVVLLTFFFSSWWPVAKRCTQALAYAARRCTLSDSQRRGVQLAWHVVAWAFVADVVSVCVYGIGKLLFKFGGISPDPGILFVGFCVTMLLFGLLWWLDRDEKNKHFFLRRYEPVWPMSKWVGSAIILGFVQGLALVPGISRFAITFVTARLLGYSPRRSFQASFVIFIPLVIAGFFVNGVGELIKNPEWLEIFTPVFFLTMVLSTIVAYGLFACAYRIACARKMSMFGLYMIVPIGLLVWFMIG